MAQKYEPDLGQAVRFLQILDPTADSRSLLGGISDGFTFQTFSDAKGNKDPALTRVIHGELGAVSKTLLGLNRKRAGVFVTINETDMAGRKLANITRVRAIWVEDDAGSSIELPLEPHIISETSEGKYHKILLVNGLSFDDHRRFQEILVADYGSDNNAKDVARVLRVPGFYHCKGIPFRVRIIHESGRKPYSLAELNAAFSGGVSVAPTNRSPYVSPENKRETLDGEYIPLSEDDDIGAVLPDITLENAEKYLPIPGEQSRKEWLDVGIILYNQFHGSQEALEMYDRWSQSVREYQGFDDVARAWHSFTRETGKKLTFRTLVREYQKRIEKEKKTADVEALEKGKQLLEDCDDPYVLTRDVAPKLWRLAEGTVALEKDFRSGLQVRFEELQPGKKLSIPEANRALKNKRHNGVNILADGEPSVPFYINPKAPGWAKGWVWVASEDRFYHAVTGTACSSRGFDGMYNCFLPKGEDSPAVASNFVRDNMHVGRVLKRTYQPDADTLFLNKKGESCLNSYHPNSGLFVPDSLDCSEGNDAAELFKAHISNLCGGWNREAVLLCNFLACCLESNPCVKIRWALLISGKQGDGKSLISDMMARALGQWNTRQINGNNIASGADTSFNGWVEGHRLGLIEEIKWHGHNRYEITNSLKPVITNDVISCHKKGAEPYDIDNRANYILNTNYDDALPVEDGDRRYFIIKSSFPLDKVKAEDPWYFTRLKDAIDSEYVGYMVRFLVDVPRHSDFKPNGHAPMTEAKRNLVNLTKDDMSDMVQEIIEDDNNPLFPGDVVCYAPLLRRVVASEGANKGDTVFERRFQRGLTSLGYIKLTRVRINGERQQLWARSDGAKQPSPDWAKGIVENAIERRNLEEGLI